MAKGKWKYITIMILCLGLFLGLGGCGKDTGESSEKAETEVAAEKPDMPKAGAADKEAAAANGEAVSAAANGEKSGGQSAGGAIDNAADSTDMADEGTGTGNQETDKEKVEDDTDIAADTTTHLIAIDPGHQTHGNSDKEPIGPGASETKAKVTGGTSGRTSGLSEYELNLQVSLKLRDILVSRGYEVIMTRESNDVNISNSERAAIANNAGAEAFVRIHANGSEDTGVSGAMTICPTPSNPYTPGIYEKSRNLSDKVLDAMAASTGCNKQYVWETDTMSGINWCQVPVTIVEMGYMTNPTEDTNMANPDYQTKIAEGIANGIDAYFGEM